MCCLLLCCVRCYSAFVLFVVFMFVLTSPIRGCGLSSVVVDCCCLLLVSYWLFIDCCVVVVECCLC